MSRAFVTLLACCASRGALAEGTGVPAHLPAGAPRIEVIDTHHASESAAGLVAPAFVAPLVRCIHQAYEADPIGLQRQTVAVAVVRLRRDGTAEAVQITPSTLARGLSSCLADALLQWHQPGRLGDRASVDLLLNLDPRADPP